MENDILLEGILEYSKNGKLKWNKISSDDISDRYSSRYIITGVKEIFLLFTFNKKSPSLSSISISMLIDIQTQRQYKYLTYNDLKVKRFDHLVNLIEYKLKN